MSKLLKKQSVIFHQTTVDCGSKTSTSTLSTTIEPLLDDEQPKSLNACDPIGRKKFDDGCKSIASDDSTYQVSESGINPTD